MTLRHAEKPGKGLVARLRRSRHADRPDPRPAKVLVADGKIVGFELSSGRFVAPDEQCCSDPLNCSECFVPISRPRGW